MAEVTLNVKGMKCGGCAKNVENALKTLPGVSAVAVDLKAAKVKVTYEGNVTADQMKQKVKDAGYKPE
jgi:copper ion binding protein